ncbi:AraC family transcriptional regulator [Priestia megaterium]|uniref:helix-turn-helix domain-containing protein n=1 Tax=Priestia megaterium TaxID=1404 RepID=UPI0021BEE7CB|nr:AraC family transcriptional regulator [Priestia megaterium]MCT9855775.1 AraC family transcriptional regulator [Priestia megaterium]MDF1962982.1 AraC family transcriptional regulator [Priestia megaterium]
MKLLGFDFTPHQPYLEYNNNYYSYKPGIEDDLYGLVWEVYQVNNFDFQKSIAFPDVCADIMLFYSPNKAHCYLMSGTKGLRVMTDLEFFKDIHTIFGVKFCSGALGNLFEGVRDTGDNIIWGNDALIYGNDTIERLLDAKTFTERWNLVRNYLIKRLNSDYEVDRLVNYVANCIVVNRGKIIIQDLESQTGYSSRYLRKKINEGLGVSIKTFCRIVQFQWSYHLYHQFGDKLSFSELAQQSGYYDQSHMNITYKKLTGLLPKNATNLYT